MLFLYNTVVGVQKHYSLNTYVGKHHINSKKLPNMLDVCSTVKGLGVHFWAMT